MESFTILTSSAIVYRIILQEKVSGSDKVVNFKDFSRPNKEIKYFLRTLTEFKDFSRRLVNFKTFSRFVQTMQSRHLGMPVSSSQHPCVCV